MGLGREGKSGVQFFPPKSLLKSNIKTLNGDELLIIDIEIKTF
jgi:hypothetical protein